MTATTSIQHYTEHLAIEIRQEKREGMRIQNDEKCLFADDIFVNIIQFNLK